MRKLLMILTKSGQVLRWCRCLLVTKYSSALKNKRNFIFIFYFLPRQLTHWSWKLKLDWKACLGPCSFCALSLAEEHETTDPGLGMIVFWVFFRCVFVPSPQQSAASCLESYGVCDWAAILTPQAKLTPPEANVSFQTEIPLYVVW